MKAIFKTNKKESHRVIYTPNKMQYFIFNQFIHMPNYSLIGFSDP